MRHGRYPFIVAFLTPAVLLYAVFVVSPYVQAFNVSTQQWSGYGAPTRVGLKNFRDMLVDPIFWKALSHNGIILVALPLVAIALALVIAFLLNVGGVSRGGVRSGVWGSSFYRVVFFFPQLLAVPIIAVLFQTVYRPNESGLIDGVLIKLGVEPVGWLINPKLALASIIAVLVWQAVGFYVVLFTAGMGSIPNEIFEAADLDGAGGFTLFFRVTLPLLWDTIQVAWVYLGIAAFDAFAIVNVLSVDSGGPDNATTVLATEIYRHAWGQGQPKLGYATAMGVALFFVTLTFSALTLRVTRREAIEY
jgi:N-acetylglucosamine transport system permease protein